ncbi:MAG: hypothetical protein A2Y14_03505 [Verrucomicrobia bacterium GWF2_51_19]|nr:MAG: hypothetical protein A2Y14_03505 [Verrucomicrobia bacterium GWF2_51_19]HCJ12393.1 hypothetical protein [Opitutae bacterium]
MHIPSVTQSIEREHFEKWVPNNKVWFSTKEVAAVLGRSTQYIRDAFENQQIMGHAISSSPRELRQRTQYQIPRDNLVLFLMQSANYTLADFLSNIESICKQRSIGELECIARIIRAHIERKGFSR